MAKQLICGTPYGTLAKSTVTLDWSTDNAVTVLDD